MGMHISDIPDPTEINHSSKETKMSNSTPKPKVTDAAYKLAKILNAYSQGRACFCSFDIEELIRKEWFELSTYAHAVHDEQKLAASLNAQQASDVK